MSQSSISVQSEKECTPPHEDEEMYILFIEQYRTSLTVALPVSTHLWHTQSTTDTGLTLSYNTAFEFKLLYYNNMVLFSTLESHVSRTVGYTVRFCTGMNKINLLSLFEWKTIRFTENAPHVHMQ